MMENARRLPPASRTGEDEKEMEKELQQMQ